MYRKLKCPKCHFDIEICQYCNGYGEYYSDKKLIKCESCKGNGLVDR